MLELVVKAVAVFPLLTYVAFVATVFSPAAFHPPSLETKLGLV